MTDALSTPPAAPDTPAAAVLDYGDPAAEYAALRTGALLVDHSARDLWVFRGPQARATVAGLVTNDVAGLAPGHGCYAAALTPKGRIVADVRVFAVEEAAAAGGGWLDGAALIVDVPPRAAEGWSAVVRKYVNPRVTPYQRAGNAVRAFGVYGARARDAVAAAFGAAPSALAALPQYAHATVVLGDTPANGAAAGETLLAVRIPNLGGPEADLDGYLLLLPAAAYDVAWARVAAAVPGVVAAGEAAYAVARIEAGYPEWGVDIDDTTIPQEANLDELGAISYTKGCYTGQEVVARVHFRGHVNRHLRGLAYPLDPAAPDVPRGASLVDDADKVVGDVRSSARSPRLGGVALGMVRREVAFDTVLRARWTDPDDAAHERAVTVTLLPFPL